MTKADEVVKQLSAELEDQFEMACVESGSNQGRISLEGLAKNLLLRIDSMGLCLMPKEATLEMLQDGHWAAKSVRRSGVSGMTIDAQTRAECVREAAAYRAMVEAGAIRLEEQV